MQKERPRNGKSEGATEYERERMERRKSHILHIASIPLLGVIPLPTVVWTEGEWEVGFCQ